MSGPTLLIVVGIILVAVSAVALVLVLLGPIQDEEYRADMPLVHLSRDGLPIAPGSDAWVCRVCGCTNAHACAGGCFWVAVNLCSRCDGREEPVGSRLDVQG